MEFFETIDLFDDLQSFIKMDRDKPKGPSIDYENPIEVSELMAWHLAKIFWAIHRGKVEHELAKLKARN